MAAFYVRLFYMQIIRHDFYKNKSQSQLEKFVALYPHRGKIYDRNNYPLALTKVSYSLYASPDKIEDKRKFVNLVAPIIDMPPLELGKKIQADTSFASIKRKLESPVYEKLKKLKLSGLHFVQEERRVYPNEHLAAQILGFVGIDNQGLGGLEYRYDAALRGSRGQLVVEGDPRGVSLITNSVKTQPVLFETPLNHGANIVTTLDHYIQYIAQKHLKKGVEEFGASSGSVIVMEPKTGEILAMANMPEFDPNQWKQSAADALKNRCVTDVFEPGSTFKLVTLAAAIEEGIVTPETVFNVPTKLVLHGATIKEAHDNGGKVTSGPRTVRDIMKESLNVGTSLVAQEMGQEMLYKYIKKFRFGERTHVEFPGEVGGISRAPKTWSGVDIAMISFGQGIAVTPIQIANATAAIANRGILMKPKLVRHLYNDQDATVQGIGTKEIDRVISAATAEKVIDMMRDAVEKGTGSAAAIPGYAIAGKTGTAQKTREGGLGYDAGRYVASFVGFLPIQNPRVVIFVVLHDPQRSIYGGVAAAPVFKNIALDIIDYYSLPPTEDPARVDKPK